MHYETPANYVSSSTRDNSTDEQGLRGLSSPDFQRLRSMTPEGHDALGRWADGTEECRVVPGPLTLGAKLGLLFHQKAILHFQPNDKGPDSRFVYHGLGNKLGPAEIREAIRAAGLPDFHTRLENGDIHIVLKASEGLAPPAPPEIDGELPAVAHGVATELGGPTREDGARVFKRVLGEAV